METFCPFHCSANLKRFKQLGEILGAPLLLCVYVSRSHGACAVFHTIQVAAQSSAPGSNRDSLSSIYSVSDRKNWDLTKKFGSPPLWWPTGFSAEKINTIVNRIFQCTYQVHWTVRGQVTKWNFDMHYVCTVQPCTSLQCHFIQSHTI